MRTIDIPTQKPPRRHPSPAFVWVKAIVLWVILLGSLLFIERRHGHDASMWFLLGLMLLSAMTVAASGPSLGFRRSTAALALVPIVGVFVVVLLTWRLCAYPNTYWVGTAFPTSWTVLGVAATTLGLVVTATQARGRLDQAGWPRRSALEVISAQQAFSREYIGDKAIASRRILMTIARGEDTLAIRESVTSDSVKHLDIFWAVPRASVFGGNWTVVGPHGSHGPGCYGGEIEPSWPKVSLCLLAVPVSATRIDVEFYGDPTVSGLALDGAAVVFLPKYPSSRSWQIKAWRAFDTAGHVVGSSPF